MGLGEEVQMVLRRGDCELNCRHPRLEARRLPPGVRHPRRIPSLRKERARMGHPARLVESHATVIIPFDDRLIFVRCSTVPKLSASAVPLWG